MQPPACLAISDSNQSIVQTIAMEKATGFEQVEPEHMGSSLEQESEPVKTIAEKEIAVQNVEYADAVKDLSPWVGIGRTASEILVLTRKSVGGIPQIVPLFSPDCSSKYHERLRRFAHGQYQRSALLYQVLRPW